MYCFFSVLGTSSSKKTLNNSASISSSTQSIHSLSSMPGDMSQVDGRVGRWALGFDKLMEDPAGLGCFKVHVQKNYVLYDFKQACSKFMVRLTVLSTRKRSLFQAISQLGYLKNGKRKNRGEVQREKAKERLWANVTKGPSAPFRLPTGARRGHRTAWLPLL